MNLNNISIIQKISNLSEVVPRCLKCFPINIGSYKEIDLQNFCAQFYFNKKIIED